MRKIGINDVTNRDGEQATDGFNSDDAKPDLCLSLEDSNVDSIELGYAASSKKDFNSVKNISSILRKPWSFVLTGTMLDHVNITIESLADCVKPGIHVHTFLINYAAFDAYGHDPIKVIDDSIRAVSVAKEGVGPDGRVEFSPQNVPYAILEARLRGDHNKLDFIKKIYEETIAAGADISNVPDTEGRVLPRHMIEAIDYLYENVQGMDSQIISVHCHNDLGLATINSLAGIMAGATQVECTINGIGERAGNAALEEVVMSIWTHGNELDCYTDFVKENLNELSRKVCQYTGWPVQNNKAIVGGNAFTHKSGEHQDAYEKARKKGKMLFELFTPKTVGHLGVPIELTARSGKTGVHFRLNELGYNITVQDVKRDVMPVYKRVADERNKLDNIDLRVIMAEVYPTSERARYVDHSLIKSMGYEKHQAEIQLKVDGEVITSEPITKTGEVDTLCTAVDSIVPIEKIPTLVSYEVRNVEKKHSSEAEVTIILSENGTKDGKWDKNVHLDKPVYVGRAKHNDVPTASVMAYVKAINEYLTTQKTQGLNNI
jgi:2-isopropylmalate synthase